MIATMKRARRLTVVAALGSLAIGAAACSDSSAESASATDPVTTAAAGTSGAEAAAEQTQTLAQADTQEDQSAAEAASSEEGDAAPASDAASETEVGTLDPASIERADAPESQGTVDMEKLLQNDALPDKILGSEDAPVTIVEYASMTCGHCRTFHEQTFPKLNEAFIQTGKVRFVFREFPFDPRATAAFMLARCSEDKYFPVVDVLFDRQDVWARAEAQNAAKSLFDTVKIAGFTEQSFDACLKDQSLLDNINAVRQRGGEEFGVDATPTFFIDGNKYSGAMTIEEMATLIDQASAE